MPLPLLVGLIRGVGGGGGAAFISARTRCKKGGGGGEQIGAHSWEQQLLVWKGREEGREEMSKHWL